MGYCLFTFGFIQSFIFTNTKIFPIKIFDLFKNIQFFLSKKFMFQMVTILRLYYGYIIICVLLFYIEVISFRLTKTLDD